MLRKIQLQNCVDWNINRRDQTKDVRDKRRFQRNIDHLNRELAQCSG